MSEKTVRNKKTPHSTSTKPAAPVKEPPAPTQPGEEFNAPPPLTADLAISYRDSHHRLLLLLCLVLAFILACFPISDPDIFFSLQVGKMVTSGEFPWGHDPFCFAAGENAPWIHSGWLGDVVIYFLYEAGGGPLLVFVRALLAVALLSMLMSLGREKSPRLLTVIAVLLAVLTLSQRLYFRTELFSLVLLGVTITLLSSVPKADCRLKRLHQLTAGRWYWLLPVVFLLWANLDAWFFLGLAVVVLWCLGAWLKPGDLTSSQVKSLSLITLLSVVASCCSPFHIRAFADIPNRLYPASTIELKARFDEQKQNNSNTRYSEQQRLFESPWSLEFLKTPRSEAVASMAGQAPFLPACYPSGLSFAEWATYPLTILLLLSLLVVGRSWNPGLVILLLLSVALGVWQSRFQGFLAVVGLGVAVLQFQSQPLRQPWLNRLAILGGQLLCLITGILIQGLCILHLIPTPDYFPSSLGHVHPRGSFGFGFRIDQSIQVACQELSRWHDINQTAGKPLHIDWTDVAAYDVWFNPGNRHFFDRRHEVHNQEISKAFITASDAILTVAVDPLKRDLSNLNRVLDRQTKWQEVFAKYNISHIIVKRRGQQEKENLIRNLLRERDKNMQPLWKALRLHNGQIFALAWAGSPHWKTLQKYEFSPGDEVFRREKPFTEQRLMPPGRPTLTSYLLGDAERRPASIEEASWHIFFREVDSVNQKGVQFTTLELNSLPGRLAMRFANPLNITPVFPYLLSNRQTSSGSLLLALEASRRAVAELSPLASAAQRLDAWLQYLQAVTSLSEYEQMFTSIAAAHREPQRLYVLRQAALSALDAQDSICVVLNWQLARSYRAVGATDAAWEHYQLGRQFLDKHPNIFANQAESPETIMKTLDAFCKQQIGVGPDELQAEFNRQNNAWLNQFPRAAIPATSREGERELLNRAGMALRMGLPKKALEELFASGSKSTDISLLACQIYQLLGQYDVVLEEFLETSPAIKESMDAADYHYWASLGEWCLGRPDRAAEHRLIIAQLIDQASRRSVLEAGAHSLLGTSTQPWGSVLVGTMKAQEAAGQSLRIADQRIAAGLLYLEAGKPQAAAEQFRQTVEVIEPDTPWRSLLNRYYLQITGHVLK